MHQRVAGASLSAEVFLCFRLQRRPGEPLPREGWQVASAVCGGCMGFRLRERLTWDSPHQTRDQVDVYQDIRMLSMMMKPHDASQRWKACNLPSSPGTHAHGSALSGCNGICRHVENLTYFYNDHHPQWRNTDALLKDPTQMAKQEPLMAAMWHEFCSRRLILFSSRFRGPDPSKMVRGGCLPSEWHGLTVEFQKRGLHHMHLSHFLQKETKIRNPKDGDDIVSARINAHVAHQSLYETVTNKHGPWSMWSWTESAPCMVIKFVKGPPLSVIQSSLNQRLSWTQWLS